ncbi:MAG: hypothetical protein ACTHN5_21355 [Phycisphaerae bacterium]
MTPLRRQAIRILPVLAMCSLMGAGARAEDAGPTLENAGSLLARAFKDAQDAPMGASRDAGLIISALRSSRDPNLLPLFEKLRQSSVKENQLYGMIASIVITKDPKRLDLKQLLTAKDPQLVASAVAALIETDIVTNDQLVQILHDASDPTLKAMAVGELDYRKALKDRDQIRKLLESDKDVVRYYAATILLEGDDAADNQAALKVLHEMSSAHNLRQAAVEAMMLVRIQKEDIKNAGPWVLEVAKDEENDEGLRYTAVTTLLAIKHPEGPRVLASLIQGQRDTIQQVKLGLISLEFGPQLKPSMLTPIAESRSELVSTIGSISKEGASGRDITSRLVKLIKQGHPIVLDWALAYSDRAEMERRVELLTAVIGQSTIVDEVRGRDYERAVLAAEKLVELPENKGRERVASLLTSNNRAVVEAVMAGIYRSNAKDQSALVLPVWDSLRKTKTAEMAANYAALILAREGHAEVTDWLSGMVLGATIQNPGFRVLAGWYYAKLEGKEQVLIQRVVAG